MLDAKKMREEMILQLYIVIKKYFTTQLMSPTYGFQ